MGSGRKLSFDGPASGTGLEDRTAYGVGDRPQEGAGILFVHCEVQNERALWTKLLLIRGRCGSLGRILRESDGCNAMLSIEGQRQRHSPSIGILMADMEIVDCFSSCDVQLFRLTASGKLRDSLPHNLTI